MSYQGLGGSSHFGREGEPFIRENSAFSQERRSANHLPDQSGEGPLPLPEGGTKRRGNPDLGRPMSQRAISNAFGYIQGWIGSEEEVYKAFGTDSREEIIKKCFRELYVLGLSANEIASDHGVSFTYVLNRIPEHEHRDRGYKMREPEYKKWMITRHSSEEAIQKRSDSAKDTWQRIKKKDPEGYQQRINRMRASHIERAEKRTAAAFGGPDVERRLNAMVRQGMNDAEIAEKTGLPEKLIPSIRGKYGIKLTRRGRGITDEQRKMAKDAIDIGYSAGLNDQQFRVVYERLVRDPSSSLREVADAVGMTPEGVRKIQIVQLAKIKKFLKRHELPDNNKTEVDLGKTKQHVTAGKAKEQIRRRPGRPEKRVEDKPVSQFTRGDLMRLARQIGGLSLPEMHNITGIPSNVLSNFENGNRSTPDNVAIIYEMLFGLHPGEILSIPGKQKPWRKKPSS